MKDIILITVIFLTTLFLFGCGAGEENQIIDHNLYPKDLKSIYIEVDKANLDVGESTNVRVKGVRKSGTIVDITDYATISSERKETLVLNEKLARGINIGSGELIASLDSFKNTLSLKVSADSFDEIEYIEVKPDNIKVEVGEYDSIRAYGYTKDNQKLDITNLVDWKIDNKNYVGIKNNEVKGINIGSTFLTAEYKTKLNKLTSSHVSVNVIPASIKSIKIYPETVIANPGDDIEFDVFVEYKNNVSSLVTSESALTEKSNNILDVIDINKFTIKKPGDTEVVANFDGYKATANVYALPVTDTISSIDIICPTQITKGLVDFCTASARTLSGQTLKMDNLVSWSVNDTNLADIDGYGEVYGKNVGVVEVSANYLGVSDKANVSITLPSITKLTLTSSIREVPLNGKIPYKLMATYTDGSISDVTNDPSVNYIISGSGVSKVDMGYIYTSNTPDLTEVYASIGSIESNSITLDVLPIFLKEIIISGSDKSIKGFSYNYTAKGKYSDNVYRNITDLVTWSSSNDYISSNVNNDFTTKAIGAYDVQAELSGISSKITVNVFDANLIDIKLSSSETSLIISSTAQLKAIGIFDDGSSIDVTKNVNFLNSSTTNIDIDLIGRITALKTGVATVYAEMNTISSNRLNIEVLDAEVVKLRIIPSSFTVPQGYSFELSVIGELSNGHEIDLTYDAIWSLEQNMPWVTSDKYVINLDGNGYIKAINRGSALVSAFFEGVKSDPASINVIDATLLSLYITESEVDIYESKYKTNKKQLKAMALFSNIETPVDVSKDPNFVWYNSADSTVGTISIDGLYTASSPGHDIVWVASDAHRTSNTKVNILPLTVKSITIDNPPSVLKTSFGRYLTTTIVYKDGSVTKSDPNLVWSSDNNLRAVVNDPADLYADPNKIFANQIGDVTITARVGSATDSFTTRVEKGPILFADSSGTYRYWLPTTYDRINAIDASQRCGDSTDYGIDTWRQWDMTNIIKSTNGFRDYDTKYGWADWSSLPGEAWVWYWIGTVFGDAINAKDQSTKRFSWGYHHLYTCYNSNRPELLM